MRGAVIKGFDYRTGVPIENERAGWRDSYNGVVEAGGYTKRIGGDMTAFSKNGKMLFEVYDNDVVKTVSA